MRVTTLNLNGIRAACRKGLLGWLAREQPDVLCLQETRAQLADLSEAQRAPEGYFGYFHDAGKRGYSGVGLYCRSEPDRVHYGLGWPEFDCEGRFIQADFGELSVVSLYLPSGSSRPERQEVKFAFMERFMPRARSMLASGRQYLLCGDWNIAHKPIDLKNWRGNQKNSGFLPEERAWMDTLFGEEGWVDAFRVVEPGEGHYTWWSNRGQAWARNVGWRIDYQVVSPALKSAIRRADIYKAERFSDHAPLTVDYAL